MGLFKTTVEAFKAGIREWLNKTKVKGKQEIYDRLKKDRSSPFAYKAYADIQERIYLMQQLIAWLQRACATAQAYAHAMQLVQTDKTGRTVPVLIPLDPAQIKPPPALDPSDLEFGYRTVTVKDPKGGQLSWHQVDATVLSKANNPIFQTYMRGLEGLAESLVSDGYSGVTANDLMRLERGRTPNYGPKR